MPEPGLYLTNASGETVPVHTEGEQDIQLLAEYIEENNLLTDLTAVSGEPPMTDGVQDESEHYQPMYCPACDEMVPEWWDAYDETFSCPECRSMTYEDKAEYIDVLHGTARWQRENGYEVTA